MANNVFGESLVVCSMLPLTGFFRDGCCKTGEDDFGTHTVCAVMTEEFLAFSNNSGNDLMTPRPDWGFPGLKPGDKWCLCGSRWLEAYLAGVAPKVFLEACHEKTLDFISLDEFVKFSI